MPNNQEQTGAQSYGALFEKLETQPNIVIDTGGNNDLKRKIQKDFSQFKARRFFDWSTSVKCSGDLVTIHRLDFNK